MIEGGGDIVGARASSGRGVGTSEEDRFEVYMNCGSEGRRVARLSTADLNSASSSSSPMPIEGRRICRTLSVASPAGQSVVDSSSEVALSANCAAYGCLVSSSDTSSSGKDWNAGDRLRLIGETSIES